ncbi:MAG: PD40 domain-containing protein [Fibrobacteres bacterium]|nr:PD40 domain-containing protein [Fibrobacterota bacterium]
MNIPDKITSSNQSNDQLLYFTSNSLLKDDCTLVFISDRTGSPNIFVRDTATGIEKQLTNFSDGYLKSYVYFDGNPYAGLGKASISLDPKNALVYFIHGRFIKVVDLNGHERTLAEYPDGQMTAFTHVSADGKRLCVPTTDARALDGDLKLTRQPEYDIDKRVREEKLNSYLRVYCTETGKELLCERVPEAWITHVQFSPLDSNVILYNNEWPSDCGIRRMWIWNGAGHRRLRTEEDGRSKEDWTCHEMWERDGKGIIYHGSYKNGIAYLGRVLPDGSGVVEIPFPEGWKRYGHFTEGFGNKLVADGYYAQPEDEKEEHTHRNGLWICLLEVDWKAKKIKWIPLCKNRSSWKTQDEHPHPIFNHNSDAVYFTSDMDGKRAIYRVNL